MKPVVVQSQAKSELRKARRWYDRRQFGLGDALLAEVLDSLSRIERDNSIGIRVENSAFWFYRLNRSPYLIYYEVLPDRVRVVAIAHERRRPDYWQRRKPE